MPHARPARRPPAAVRAAAPDNAALFDDFRQVYDVLNALERLLLRQAPAD
jgi:hypothetical protein